ncbi:MAG: hypothetical protein ACU843_10705 [Gammaproteobacteria bacterium]
MNIKTSSLIFGGIIATAIGQPAFSEAIWTSLSNGAAVNFNIYAAKQDVYLNGGPGQGAGSNAQGLPDGTYVFQVTSPDGKVLLSQDPAGCRLVQVIGGVITGAATWQGDPGCKHANGDVLPGGTPVQLSAPPPPGADDDYADTPNNGGVYKVWLTSYNTYSCNFDLTIVDCPMNTHGFVPADSKTDNFKVGIGCPHEVDTTFHDENWQRLPISGLKVPKTDTHGAHNQKFSELNQWGFFQAHDEKPEAGNHDYFLVDQEECLIDDVYVNHVSTRQIGPQTISVHVTNAMIRKCERVDIEVRCKAINNVE